MKTTFKIFIAALVSAIAVLVQTPAIASVLENPNGYNAFGGTGIAQGTTNSFFVAGNYTLNTGTPVVRYLNVSSDLATSKVQFYVVSNKVTITGVVSGTTNVTVTSTNGFTINDVVLIKHSTSDTYERLKLFNVANTNQLTVQYAMIQTPAAGDTLWLAKPAGSIAIGATTNSIPTGAGTFIYAGQYGTPLLMEVNGTSTATINAVSGDFR